MLFLKPSLMYPNSSTFDDAHCWSLMSKIFCLQTKRISSTNYDMGLDKNLGLDNAFKAVYKPIHINFGTCFLIFSHEYYSRFVSMRFSHDRKETMLVLHLKVPRLRRHQISGFSFQMSASTWRFCKSVNSDHESKRTVTKNMIAVIIIGPLQFFTRRFTQRNVTRFFVFVLKSMVFPAI